MNKLGTLALTACIICMAVSCKSGSENRTLENTNGLLAEIIQVENGDTLRGVKTIFDTIQVVPSAKWDSLKAMSPDVVSAYRDGQMFAFTSTGKKLGKGSLKELLTITSSDNVTFYRGAESDSASVFFYPSSDSVIEGITNMYIGRTVGLFETSNGWEVRDYAGGMLWQISDEDCCILRRIYAEEETIQIALMSKKGAEIYNVKGELVAEVSKAEWKKATKSFRRTAKIGTADYGELDVNYQF